MALVEIEDIELGTPQRGKIRAFAIDAPRIGYRNVYDIEFTGWVLGAEQPVQEIEIHHGGVIIRRAPLDQQRVDVARDYPDSPGSGTCGFRTSVSVIGLEPEDQRSGARGAGGWHQITSGQCSHAARACSLRV